MIVRSTTVPGLIRLTAKAQGLDDAILEWTSRDKPCTTQKRFLERGETPLTPSYTEKKRTITILSAEAGANQESAKCSWDDNELSEWKNDGKLSTAWIAYTLGESVAVDEISIKLTGWRKRSYPIEVYAVTDDGKAQMVWKGNTEKSLGYVSLCLKNPVKARKYIIKQVGTATEKDAFGQVTELAGGPATELDLYKTPGSEKVKGELRIVEIDFLKWK